MRTGFLSLCGGIACVVQMSVLSDGAKKWRMTAIIHVVAMPPKFTT